MVDIMNKFGNFFINILMSHMYGVMEKAGVPAKTTAVPILVILQYSESESNPESDRGSWSSQLRRLRLLGSRGSRCIHFLKAFNAEATFVQTTKMQRFLKTI